MDGKETKHVRVDEAVRKGIYVYTRENNTANDEYLEYMNMTYCLYVSLLVKMLVCNMYSTHTGHLWTRSLTRTHENEGQLSMQV